MEEIEITAPTVEQAIKKAEAQLGMSREQLQVEVVREGKSGILGMGSREALIKVTPMVAPQKDIVREVTQVVQTLLDLLGVSARLEVVSSELPIGLNIVGDDLGILIGRGGRALASLEYVAKLVVMGRLKAWVPLAIDVGEYRKRRRDSLQKLALYLAEQVKSRGRAITMEPMPAHERRIIHLALANNPDVTTRSIGEGENRKIVILPKQG